MKKKPQLTCFVTYNETRETSNLGAVRTLDSGYCWMYTVIVIEIIMLVILIVEGL